MQIEASQAGLRRIQADGRRGDPGDWQEDQDSGRQRGTEGKGRRAITPGPVVITVAFIGYLVAGPLGGLVAALGKSIPTYLAVVLMAPWFRPVMANRSLRYAVDGVTAAAAGAIAGAVVVLGRRALIDGPTWTIALLTLMLLWWARRIPEPALIVGAGLVGLLLPR